ncbi:hypothetical protein M427DRAFT_52885 [Gonapodya prolifera JEL478]|uniref:Uncharacterized protein n=1 Tax=Gonapodya prolifera (strain JEL478) TaxID=1344416 RepID=A0A139AS19_GONPJ|nr:hypothetical protein M427DRAFT_52885 [Gonapodya prolifera JEL478]|eukprot:KXS19444.1 hypothetical protein M427DRAFT_52885 [Gonapodya prolifera JEL478]
MTAEGTNQFDGFAGFDGAGFGRCRRWAESAHHFLRIQVLNRRVSEPAGGVGFFRTHCVFRLATVLTPKMNVCADTDVGDRARKNATSAVRARSEVRICVRGKKEGRCEGVKRSQTYMKWGPNALVADLWSENFIEFGQIEKGFETQMDHRLDRKELGG